MRKIWLKNFHVFLR